jgi:hypothetical protein
LSLDGTPITISTDTDNANWAMLEIQPVLENIAAHSIERARFLAFLVHIVGDLHQPLHNVSAVSKETPDGDLGGNLFIILNPKQTTESMSLHSLWDSAFGLFSGASNSDLNQLALEITMQYPEDYFGNKAQDLSPQHWTKEGVSYAKNLVYQTERNQIPSEEYQLKGKQLVQQQIALAGYRLAHLLNKILSAA